MILLLQKQGFQAFLIHIILLLILLPVLGISTTGDETLKGRLQTFVSYGLSLMSILLCLLTIIVSIYSVTSDIEHRQIYTVITKPIRRFQFLLGKLLGVIVLDVILLVLFSAIIYTITIYIPEFFDAPEIERTEANNEFLTARASLTVPEVDVSQEVKDRYEELERRGFKQVVWLTPTIEMGIIIFLVYTIIFLIIAAIIFKRRQL